MSTFFLDTGYIIALEASDDKNHLEAVQHWKTCLEGPLKVVTTTYVFDEVVTFFNSRNRHDKAVELGKRLLESPTFELVEVDKELFVEGWDYFQKYEDKRYSLTDCISFVLMQKLGLQTALAFD